MRIIVDRMPEEPRGCAFVSGVTGRWMCTLDRRPCPLASGGECGKLCAAEAPAAMDCPKIGTAKKSGKK